MKLILKIAVGVFLGIGALLLVIKAPGWIEQFQQESADNSALTAIDRLSLQKITSVCGDPKHDVIMPDPDLYETALELGWRRRTEFRGA